MKYEDITGPFGKQASNSNLPVHLSVRVPIFLTIQTA